jgi:hypothetical protein
MLSGVERMQKQDTAGIACIYFSGWFFINQRTCAFGKFTDNEQEFSMIVLYKSQR